MQCKYHLKKRDTLNRTFERCLLKKSRCTCHGSIYRCNYKLLLAKTELGKTEDAHD